MLIPILLGKLQVLLVLMMFLQQTLMGFLQALTVRFLLQALM